MPRVHHIKKARKDNPCCKKGESYYFWEFAFAGKSYSKTRPRQSQLTRSAYYSALFSLQEMIEDYTVTDADDFDSLRSDVESSLEELRDEQQEKIDNMTEHGLEYTPSGELIQERLDCLEISLGELDMAGPAEEDKGDELIEALDEAKSLLSDYVGEAHV